MAKFGKLEFNYSELEYIDVRPIFISGLAAYKQAPTIAKGQIIKVTPKEKMSVR